MNAATHLDANIPVLTEVISVEDESLVAAEAPIAVQHPEPVVEAPLSEQTLEQLEKTLRENVLRQLLTRVDFVLEHRVRDGLADVLQTAVDGLAKEIRTGLAKSLEEVIQRTVSQEISKIQSLNSKP
ncbi:hypothetical protein AAKU67_001050 [Oxalobacteraceae bacterium GrIS 2.11]